MRRRHLSALHLAAELEARAHEGGVRRVVRHGHAVALAVEAAREDALRRARARAHGRARAAARAQAGEAVIRHAPEERRRSRARARLTRLRQAPLIVANVREALAEERSALMRAEAGRARVIGVAARSELALGRRDVALDALVRVVAAAHDCAVRVARPRVCRACRNRGVGDEGHEDRLLAHDARLQLRGCRGKKGRDPGVDRLRALFLQHVRPVARLIGDPARVGGQRRHNSLVAQLLRERAALVVARRAEHLARASPVRDVSLLGRLRAKGACCARQRLGDDERDARELEGVDRARCALFVVAEGEREAVELRHGCWCACVSRWEEVCGGLFLSTRITAPLVQIFYIIDSARHLRTLCAQKFTLCFTSQKNLKEPCRGARARPPARPYARLEMICALKYEKKLNIKGPYFD